MRPKCSWLSLPQWGWAAAHRGAGVSGLGSCPAPRAQPLCFSRVSFPSLNCDGAQGIPGAASRSIRHLAGFMAVKGRQP